MEEDQNPKSSNDDIMIGALQDEENDEQGVNEENGDNEDLLDDDFLGEDLEWMESEKRQSEEKQSSNAPSGSHEDSLNETITAFKAKVKSKGQRNQESTRNLKKRQPQRSFLGTYSRQAASRRRQESSVEGLHVNAASQTTHQPQPPRRYLP
ncbi:unnamed protein product [Microthlaspi erraticum]|nr:unnamed protein product [Microthlaspi erraticum]CAA7055796.1 unnamed protein product [Microthlaspi erraticum]